MNEIVGRCTVVNPGSIGQPRNGKDPTFVVLDSITKKLTFIDIEYDKTELLKKIENI